MSSPWASVPERRPSPPGVISAAVWVTWVIAAGAALVAVFLVAAGLLVGGILSDAFELGRWWPLWVVLAGVAALACCLGSALLARGVLRGVNAARWGLVAFWTLAIPIGAMTAYYVLPGMAAMCGVGVIVLLLLPDSRAWTKHPADLRELFSGSPADR